MRNPTHINLRKENLKSKLKFLDLCMYNPFNFKYKKEFTVINKLYIRFIYSSPPLSLDLSEELLCHITINYFGKNQCHHQVFCMCQQQ